MRLRGCVFGLFYAALLMVVFAASSYFWFKFWVRGKSIPTPNLVGRTLSESRAVCSDLGLVVVVDNTKDRLGENIPAGSIVWQNRTAGSLIKRGTRIHVGQSLGPLVLRVPDVAGTSSRTALLRLSQFNLRLGTISYFTRHKLENTVAADPPIGTPVDNGAQVSLLVALPEPGIAFVMPDLINRKVEDVRYGLENYGFVLSNIKFESYPGIVEGTIIRQFPIPGGMVRKGEAISLVVAKQGIITE